MAPSLLFPGGAVPPRLVCIGASAGGLAPVREIVSALPAMLPAAVFVVIHVAPDSPSHLASILERSGAMRESDPALKAIIASGNLDGERRSAMQKQGIRATLRKPYGAREIVTALRKLLD
ncbi:MAG: hypothetical protein M3167_07305 [Acidobacteriota bacterium]|nr:hypothetical protein [Acidobacteriota bacterium]